MMEMMMEKMMDKTIADSFPASDPPSSIPIRTETPLGCPRCRKVRDDQDQTCV
jgi:hypothetical protein